MAVWQATRRAFMAAPIGHYGTLSHSTSTCTPIMARYRLSLQTELCNQLFCGSAARMKNWQHWNNPVTRFGLKIKRGAVAGLALCNAHPSENNKKHWIKKKSKWIMHNIRWTTTTTRGTRSRVPVVREKSAIWYRWVWMKMICNFSFSQLVTSAICQWEAHPRVVIRHSW